MKIVLTNMDDLVDELRATYPDVTFETADDLEEQKLQIRDADAYMGWPEQDVFLEGKKLRWVHVGSTGIDRLRTMVPAMIDSDVVLTNTRGPHADTMADHALGMMLNFVRPYFEWKDEQRKRRWTRIPEDRFLDLHGYNMGLVGLGDVGIATARRAHGFGMIVHSVDKFPKPPWYKPPEVRESWGLDRLDEMLALSDWVVVTAPLTPDTRGLLDRRRISLMKEGVYVIAVSRGNIIDEEALIEGLRSGHIAGAGLDVMSVEPLPEDSPLWDMDNVILTPHSAAVSPDRSIARIQVFKENLRRFLSDEPFLYVCDKRAGF
jgi:phosphoglycerate dehydrogenase-like enzyme